MKGFRAVSFSVCFLEQPFIVARTLGSGFIDVTNTKINVHDSYGTWISTSVMPSCKGLRRQSCQIPYSPQFFPSASFQSTQLCAAFESTDHGQEKSVRTDVEHFLTQRAVQSFMMLCADGRDPHTVKWLDSFGNTTNLLDFHGTGGLSPLLFPKWDSYLLNLIDQNKETITIQARRRGAGSHGWSKNNPYIQERFINYYVKIDPLNMVGRIITVREQLAEEWVEDLDVLVQSSDSIMDSYMANVRKSTMDSNSDPSNNAEAGYGYDESGDQIHEGNNGDDGGKAKRNDNDSDIFPNGVDTTTTKINLDHLWSSYLKSNPSSCQPQQQNKRMNDIVPGEPDTLANPRRHAFDRNGAFFLRNRHAFRVVASSPLRGGSFDLLVLLSTQEAIIRLLRQYRHEMEDKGHIYEFLRDFYVRHLPTTFDGSSEHGRADDFLESLMIVPPRISRSGREVTMIDPLGLAEKIIHARKQVALEWKAIITSSCPIKESDEATGDITTISGAPSHEHIRGKLHQKTQSMKHMKLSEEADDLEERAVKRIKADVIEALAREQEVMARGATQQKQQQCDPQEENEEIGPKQNIKLPFGITEGVGSSKPKAKSYSPWSTRQTPVASSAPSEMPYGPPTATKSNQSSTNFDNNQSDVWGEFQ